jgi:tetratricopeptide (TPR) repeat protein
MRQRHYAEAVELFRSALMGNERNPQVHEGLATAAFMMGDYALAVEHFKRVTMLDPRRAQALVNLGAVYNRQEDYSNAIQTLRKAVTKDNKCAEAYYNLGLAHRGLNQLQMAASAYKEAIRLNPEMAEAYQNLANVYSDMGNTQQAILHYERALQIRPDFERARRGLERARGVKQKAADEASPFGRLVDVSQLKRSADVTPVARSRELTEQERFEDRSTVHGIAKTIEQSARATLQQLQSELEPALLAFSRAFAQARDARGYWHEYKGVTGAFANFEKLWQSLSVRTDELRVHEETLQNDGDALP